MRIKFLLKVLPILSVPAAAIIYVLYGSYVKYDVKFQCLKSGYSDFKVDLNFDAYCIRQGELGKTEIKQIRGDE